MTLEQLKEKALGLPLSPGVYIMRDRDNRVIYVGKAKKLKNRVSQYFQDSASHSPKTRLMVSHVDHFDVIVAASEFEALVLECSQIKQYMPKYNILLKDDKGYPYIRLDMKEEYPALNMVGKVSDDGAEYFGPYGGRSITQSVLDTISRIFNLPNCSKVFPKDLGKGRPCLHYHMKQCAGWCMGEHSKEDYRNRVLQARRLLLGDYKIVAQQIRKEMLKASEELQFELAAVLRDRLQSIEALQKKQFVTAGRSVDTHVIGYGCTEAKACFAVLHYSDGNLIEKDYEVFSLPDDPQEAVSSLLKQFYLHRQLPPRQILLPFEIEDSDLIAQWLQESCKHKVMIFQPKRGENVRLLQLACKNAYEEALRLTEQGERERGTLQLLGKMLSIPAPKRMESYDISNISGTDIVGSMVVFQDGKPYKKDYKRFKLEGLSQQDDYASMAQVLQRRFSHYLAGDSGFDQIPDLLLIDGGIQHAKVALEVLEQLQLEIPVFGMVKDHRHRTRALVTPQGQEIRIDNQQSIFALIGTIQEETHRFAITYHKQLRSKRLRYSALDRIPGIGEKRKQLLLKRFHSLQAISKADMSSLLEVLPKDAASAVYQHFHSNSEE